MKYDYTEIIIDCLKKRNGDNKNVVYDEDDMNFIQSAIRAINDSHFPELDGFRIFESGICNTDVNGKTIITSSDPRGIHSIKMEILKNRVTLYSDYYKLRISIAKNPNNNTTFDISMFFKYEDDIIYLNRTCKVINCNEH